MSKQCLLENVNLSQILFPVKGGKVVLEFLNMFDGADVGAVHCTGLWLFDYHTFPDSDLPHYAGEVNVIDVAGPELAELLRKQHYRYGITPGDEDAARKAPVRKVEILGGDIEMHIICETVAYIPAVIAQAGG